MECYRIECYDELVTTRHAAARYPVHPTWRKNGERRNTGSHRRNFWAAWCGPCRALAPVVDEIAKSYQGKLKVAKMDVDRNTATPQRYGVRGIPTLLVFKGGQVQEQIVGYVPKETIEKALDKLA